jgi:hypothetical protein
MNREILDQHLRAREAWCKNEVKYSHHASMAI